MQRKGLDSRWEHFSQLSSTSWRFEETQLCPLNFTKCLSLSSRDSCLPSLPHKHTNTTPTEVERNSLWWCHGHHGNYSHGPPLLFPCTLFDHLNFSRVSAPLHLPVAPLRAPAHTKARLRTEWRGLWERAKQETCRVSIRFEYWNTVFVVFFTTSTASFYHRCPLFILFNRSVQERREEEQRKERQLLFGMHLSADFSKRDEVEDSSLWDGWDRYVALMDEGLNQWWTLQKGNERDKRREVNRGTVWA